MSDILKKYNEQSWKLAYYPDANGISSGRKDELVTRPRFAKTSLDTSFNKTSLDLENPKPLGGPINVPYMTPVGTGVISSPTTQPFTPKRTYKDSFQDPLLIARATDPYK
jgi:hypothetical protein